MSVTSTIIAAVIMTVVMIGLVLLYLGKGYSYKHTIDELPDSEGIEKTEETDPKHL